MKRMNDLNILRGDTRTTNAVEETTKSADTHQEVVEEISIPMQEEDLFTQ